MEPLEKMKTLFCSKCPKCNAEIMIEIMTNWPEIVGIFTEEDFEKARLDVIEQIKKSKLSKAKIKEIVDWVEDKKNIFSPTDVKSIIENILETNKNDIIEEDKN